MRGQKCAPRGIGYPRNLVMICPSTRLKLLVAIATVLVAVYAGGYFYAPTAAALRGIAARYHDSQNERQMVAQQAVIDSQTTRLPRVDAVIVYSVGEVDDSLK